MVESMGGMPACCAALPSVASTPARNAKVAYQSQMCASPCPCTVPRRAAGTAPPDTHDDTRVPPAKHVDEGKRSHYGVDGRHAHSTSGFVSFLSPTWRRVKKRARNNAQEYFSDPFAGFFKLLSHLRSRRTSSLQPQRCRRNDGAGERLCMREGVRHRLGAGAATRSPSTRHTVHSKERLMRGCRKGKGITKGVCQTCLGGDSCCRRRCRPLVRRCPR